jgi:hypothetical protein
MPLAFCDFGSPQRPTRYHTMRATLPFVYPPADCGALAGRYTYREHVPACRMEGGKKAALPS